MWVSGTPCGFGCLILGRSSDVYDTNGNTVKRQIVENMMRLTCLLCAIALIPSQISGTAGQSTAPPGGASCGQSLSLTPTCRTGSAGTLAFNGGALVNAVPDKATVRPDPVRYQITSASQAFWTACQSLCLQCASIYPVC